MFKVGDKVFMNNRYYEDEECYVKGEIVSVTKIISEDSVGIMSLDKSRSRDVFISCISLLEEPKKYNTGKPMMSLVRPEFQLALAEALTYGYTKYDEKRGDIQNYLKGDGFHYSSILDSLERHINAFKSGQSFDVGESELHHLSLAAANLMFLYAYETSDKGIDDRVVLNESI
jgi:hypothetical protein